jgi:hypothetical protein
VHAETAWRSARHAEVVTALMRGITCHVCWHLMRVRTPGAFQGQAGRIAGVAAATRRQSERLLFQMAAHCSAESELRVRRQRRAENGRAPIFEIGH